MNSSRVAARRLTVLVALVFLAVIDTGSAFASDEIDVIAAVHGFFDNLSSSTVDKAITWCDPEISIVDEFPPHVWHGATACSDWWKVFGEYNQKNGVTPGDAKIGTPWSVDVAGDRAYVVAPATYEYKQHGKDVKEPHAVFTAALRKTGASWRITAWTWSKH